MDDIICHNHMPSSRLIRGCKYCEKFGNIFHFKDILPNRNHEDSGILSSGPQCGKREDD